jgi:3-hydroxyisobutyrate dehydrogenase-like beta-hydroxyacid dehydrogenase
MGSGMAANLLKAGHKLTITDLRREQCKGLEGQGATFRESPKAVAESCDVVCSMLPYNQAVQDVGLGKNGLHEASSGARLWIDFSSIDKKTVVGVSKAAFDQHQDVFKAMGNKILFVGELGNAKLVKNAMAMFAAVQHLSLAEICSWLRKGGLTEDTFRTILKNSMQDSVAIDRIMEIVVSKKYKPRKSWMPKDVGFGLDMAREMEVPMPFVALAYQMFSIAQANGQDGYEATGIASNVYDIITGVKK